MALLCGSPSRVAAAVAQPHSRSAQLTMQARTCLVPARCLMYVTRPLTYVSGSSQILRLSGELKGPGGSLEAAGALVPTARCGVNIVLGRCE